MIRHFSIILVHFVFFVNLIVFFSISHKIFIIKYLLIIIVFKLGSDQLVSCWFYCLSPRDQSQDVTPRLGEGGWFFIFDYSSPFCFLVIEIHYTFSISYIVLTSYAYYYVSYLIRFNTLFSCFFAGFLLFSAKGSVTGCDSSLGSLQLLKVYFISRSCIYFPATIITTM